MAAKEIKELVGSSVALIRDIEAINQAVVEMDEVTQHNAVLVEQAAAAARSLDEQVTNQNAAMSSFKIAGGQ